MNIRKILLMRKKSKRGKKGSRLTQMPEMNSTPPNTCASKSIVQSCILQSTGGNKAPLMIATIDGGRRRGGRQEEEEEVRVALVRIPLMHCRAKFGLRFILRSSFLPSPPLPPLSFSSSRLLSYLLGVAEGRLVDALRESHSIPRLPTRLAPSFI